MRPLHHNLALCLLLRGLLTRAVLLLFLLYGRGFALTVGDHVQATTGVNIRVSPSLGGAIDYVAPTGATGTIISGPTYANAYTWWRVQWDSDYPTGWSVETYLAKISPPAPGSFNISYNAPEWSNADGAPKVQIYWGPSLAADGYDVYMDGARVAAGLTQESFTKQYLTQGRTYYFYVIARNSGGATQSNNNLTVGPMPGPPSSPPSAFSIENNPPVWDAANNTPSVYLYWPSVSGASTYETYRNGTQLSTGYSQNYFTNTSGLVPGQTYQYHVIARGPGGATQSTNTLTIGPLPSAPVATVGPPTLTSPGTQSDTGFVITSLTPI